MLDNIVIKSGKIDLHGVLGKPAKTMKSGVVFLHGGGTSSAKRYEKLQKGFSKLGITSLAVDFRGCGNSGGKYKDGSLENRLKDALAGVKYLLSETGITNTNLYIWGSSMGAHVACRIVNKVEPKGLILQSAAAYSMKAETLSLGKRFTAEIRAENSYVNSPAFVEVKKYKGKLLVMYWASETMIPIKVKQEYRDIVRDKGGKYIEFAGEGHAMLEPKNEKEKMVFEMMLEVGGSFILG